MSDDPRCKKCGHPRSNHTYRHPFVGTSRDETIEQQTARIRELEAQVGRVTVKRLEWWDPSRDNNWTHGARTFFCTYYVGICGGRHNAWTELFHEGHGIEQWDGPTRGRLEEAKEDAQADYERRILSALSPAPVTVSEAARVLIERIPCDEDAIAKVQCYARFADFIAALCAIQENDDE
jgi:hypothetical protein